MKKLVLLLLCGCSLSLSAQDISGTWSGRLKVGGNELRIVFNISPADSGYTATMDSPDQGAKGLPVSSVKFKMPEVTIEMKQFGAMYAGRLVSDTLMEGTFLQGAAFPLSLAKKQPEKANRPQEPRPPFLYRSEEVRFDNKAAGITLVGTLTLPAQGGVFPAVVLVSGSGPQNRDEEIMEHKPFHVIADFLTRRGVAVLRYDDRGVGASTGSFMGGTTRDFAQDAMSALEFLRGRPDIDSRNVGVIGHSEGGTVAFIMAADNPNVAFVVSLAGGAVRGDELLVRQNKDLLVSHGYAPDVADAYCKALEKVFDVVQNNSGEYIAGNIDAITAGLLTEKESALLPDALHRNLKTILATPLTPWMKSMLAFDPSPYIAATRCPVLALNGGSDLQVNADVNLSAIDHNLRTAGNNNLTTIKYDGLNHLFQHSSTGALEEYALIEETFAPEVLEEIAEWITRVTK